MKGAPRKIQRKQGVKVTQVASRPPSVPASSGDSVPGSRKAARKPTNCSTMISGPGVVSAMPRPSSISPRLQPVIVLDRLLRDIGEHRIGAAEGDHRHLAEEQRDLAEHVGRAERRAAAPRPAPARAAARRAATLQRAGECSDGRGRAIPSPSRLSAVGGRLLPPPCRAPAANSGRPRLAADIADHAGAEDDERERHVEKEDRDEGDARRARSSPGCCSARLPMRTTASSTIASTAAFRPKNSAATKPTLPKAA